MLPYLVPKHRALPTLHKCCTVHLQNTPRVESKKCIKSTMNIITEYSCLLICKHILLVLALSLY